MCLTSSLARTEVGRGGGGGGGGGVVHLGLQLLQPGLHQVRLQALVVLLLGLQQGLLQRLVVEPGPQKAQLSPS